MVKTHKITKQKLLLKEDHGKVSTLYVLDDNGNKILDKRPIGKGVWHDVEGNPVYKIVICNNDNLL